MAQKMAAQTRTKELLKQVGLAGSRLERYAGAVDSLENQDRVQAINDRLERAVQLAPHALASVRGLIQHRNRPQVLLVHPDDRELARLRNVMGERFFDVRAMHTAEEALAASHQMSTAALVCNFTLPNMTGLALLERLRAQQRGLLAMILTKSIEEMGKAAAHYATALRPADVESLFTALRSAFVEREREQLRLGEPVTWSMQIDDEAAAHDGRAESSRPTDLSISTEQ